MTQRLTEEVNNLMREEAWDAVRALAQREPSDLQRSFELCWNAGWALVRLERAQESLPHFRRAILLLSPSSSQRLRAVAEWGLGVALVDAGLLEEAEARFQKALGVTDSYLTRINLGALYLRLGKSRDAEHVYREGVRLQPEHRERLEALADFLAELGRQDEAASWNEAAAELPTREERRRRRAASSCPGTAE